VISRSGVGEVSQTAIPCLPLPLTAEGIEVLFGDMTLGVPLCSTGGPSPSTARGGGAHSMQPLPDYFGFLFGDTVQRRYRELEQ